ncbi:MAG: PKD domain-containing protein [Actinomycetes bacterium]
MIKGTVTVAAALAVLVSLPGSVLAAPKRVPPTEILSSVALGNVKVGVSPRDEAIVVGDIDNGASDPTLVARVRGSGGRLSVAQELSRTGNAEVPRDIEFNAGGDTFLSWGIATGRSPGERSFRKAGGLFSVPMPWPEGSCTRLSSVRFTADGLPEVACSATLSSGAARDTAISVTGSTSEGVLFGLPTTLQPAVNFGFLTPHLDIGPDGTRAVAWRVDEGSGPGQAQKVKFAVAPPGGPFGSTQQAASVLLSTGGFAELGGISVLADGRVAILYERSGGGPPQPHVLIRKPDGTLVDLPLPTTTAQGRISIVRDGTGALVLWAEDSGFATPVTFKVGSLVGDSIPDSSIQTLDNGVSGMTQTGDLLVAPNGAAAFARRLSVAGDQVLGAWVRPARGRPFAGPFTIGSEDSISSFSAALDKHGSLSAAWIRDETVDKVFFGGLDAAGPSLSRLAMPARLRAGRAGRFSVSATDPAGVKAVKWSFGDRKSATGGRVGHSFARPGRYRVTVTATDEAGQSTKASRVVAVGR